MAAVYTSNLTVNCNSDFNQTFELENSDSSSALDLTGYTITSQMRKHAGSSTKTDFTTSIVSATAGRIKISLTDTVCAAIKPGRYVYDVLVTDSVGMKTRVVEGSVLVREAVTR